MARYGQTIKSSLIGWYRASSNYSINQPAGVDYWTENNQGAYYPVPGSGDEQKVMSALTYRDGSFIKVKKHYFRIYFATICITQGFNGEMSFLCNGI